MQRTITAIAGMLFASAASATTLSSYDLSFVIAGGPSSGTLNDVPLQADPEVVNFGVSFDMIDGESFSISWNPAGVAHSDLFVYISDLTFMSIPDPADILTLTLESGPEAQVFSIIADAKDSAFGAPAMQFNIDRDGSFDTGGATWTFAYTTDVTPIPVPAALPLAAAGLGALAWLRRRRG